MCKALEEIMEERIVEREQQARKEEREKVRVETKAEDLLECLKKHGEISDNLEKRILLEGDLEILKHWFQIALSVRSIEEFQNAM